MPRVIKIAPKDIYVTIELGIGEMEKISTAISLSRIDYDGKKVEEADAVSYLTKEFFPFINDILEGVEKNGS